ncbi:carboxymuconolactone decarboxylase family protein [Streptomyces atratus]|jgi:AhpD family alkylhydroperoxidase|uniref:Alkylhydroperoxidase AhpD family core domain-containing protein n=1 Tax=Streptomyces atratus TaxID=1893 RepID=A0A1K2D8X3_STRAR|nr:carboxymuconolactone decarboxylase family protein [Streptomyces atratus]SFY19831.1 alkylhydroperoxidase AhpD family core domain-containing protein [Streptomyces atratus]
MTNHSASDHTPRLDTGRLAPEVHRAMLELDRAASAGIDPGLAELVRIRASQLNRCAFCLDMHTTDALATGESAERIAHLSAWEVSRHCYTDKELAALELTEALTVAANGSASDLALAKAARHFDERELTHLIATVIAINVLNRLAISVRMTPGYYARGSRRR